MRRPLIFLLLFAPLIASVLNKSSSFSDSDTSLATSDSGAAARHLFSSLLPPALRNDAALLVTPDGKVVSVKPETMEIEWALSSGSKTHSSYQNVSYFNRNGDHSFVDIGENWLLYRHSNSKGKHKLSSSIREYVATTPLVSENGGVTLGSKITKVFAVDTVTGQVIRSFTLGDNSPASLGMEPTAACAEGLGASGPVLYLERTDFTLPHCTAKGDLLWKLEIAEFDAQYRYPNLGLENRLVANSTVPYLKEKPVVIRLPYPASVESCSVIEGLTGGYYGGKPLPLEAAHDNILALPFGKGGPVPPHYSEGSEMLALPSLDVVDSRILALPGRDVGNLDITSSVAESLNNFLIEPLFVFLLPLISILGCIFCSLTGKRHKPKVTEGTKAEAGVLKRKKTRRLGNNKKNNIYEKDARNMSSECKFCDSTGSANGKGNEKVRS